MSFLKQTFVFEFVFMGFMWRVNLTEVKVRKEWTAFMIHVVSLWGRGYTEILCCSEYLVKNN